jgi:hypothetical protein
MNPTPILSSPSSPFLAPAAGGGQAVTLQGSGLSGALAVQVGSNQIKPISTTKTSITFVWPPNAASATPYDITVIFPDDGDDHANTTSNTLRSAVYYLPSNVTNAWYAAEFYSSGVWTDLIAGVQEAPFGSLLAPPLASQWSNGEPALGPFSGTQGLRNASLPVQPQPGAIFVVGQTGNLAATNTYFGGNWQAYQTGAGLNGTPASNAGVELDDTTDRLTKPSIAEYVFNGADSSITVNGGIRTTGNAGTNALAGLTLGVFADGVTRPLTGGYEALVLVYNGIPSVGDEAIITAIATSLYATPTATLCYTLEPVAPITATQLLAATTAVDLQLESIQTATGCTLISDVTIQIPETSIIQRCIKFALTPAFQSGFTSKTLAQAIASGSWASPFNNLYKHTLGAVLGSDVTAAAPIIAQSF